MFQYSQEAKFFNNPRPKYVPRGKIFQYLHIVYYLFLILQAVRLANLLKRDPRTGVSEPAVHRLFTK